MTIKKATFIALCGNGAILAIRLITELKIIGGYFLYVQVFRGHFELLSLLAGPGTLIFFLLTLYRKQP